MFDIYDIYNLCVWGQAVGKLRSVVLYNCAKDWMGDGEPTHVTSPQLRQILQQISETEHLKLETLSLKTAMTEKALGNLSGLLSAASLKLVTLDIEYELPRKYNGESYRQLKIS